MNSASTIPTDLAQQLMARPDKKRFWMLFGNRSTGYVAKRVWGLPVTSCGHPLLYGADALKLFIHVDANKNSIELMDQRTGRGLCSLTSFSDESVSNALYQLEAKYSRFQVSSTVQAAARIVPMIENTKLLTLGPKPLRRAWQRGFNFYMILSRASTIRLRELMAQYHPPGPHCSTIIIKEQVVKFEKKLQPAFPGIHHIITFGFRDEYAAVQFGKLVYLLEEAVIKEEIDLERRLLKQVNRKRIRHKLLPFTKWGRADLTGESLVPWRPDKREPLFRP